jgi:hypothetical protein
MAFRCLTAALLHLILLPSTILQLTVAATHPRDDDIYEPRGSQLIVDSPTQSSPQWPRRLYGTRLGSHSAIPFDTLDALRDALSVMQTTWFEVWVGSWPTAIDWTRAVIDTQYAYPQFPGPELPWLDGR